MSRKLYSGESPVDDRDALQRAVNGEVFGLMEGLSWRMTPQGANHWAQVFCGEKKMSRRSRRYLNALLNESR